MASSEPDEPAGGKNETPNVAGTLNTPLPVGETHELDPLAEGLVQLFQPAIAQIDLHVGLVRQSQRDLRKQIESLSEDLRRIHDACLFPIELEPAFRRLNQARRRLVLLNGVLQNSYDRLLKLQETVGSEREQVEMAIEATSSLEASSSAPTP